MIYEVKFNLFEKITRNAFSHNFMYVLEKKFSKIKYFSTIMHF